MAVMIVGIVANSPSVNDTNAEVTCEEHTRHVAKSNKSLCRTVRISAFIYTQAVRFFSTVDIRCSCLNRETNSTDSQTLLKRFSSIHRTFLLCTRRLKPNTVCSSILHNKEFVTDVSKFRWNASDLFTFVAFTKTNCWRYLLLAVKQPCIQKWQRSVRQKH